MKWAKEMNHKVLSPVSRANYSLSFYPGVTLAKPRSTPGYMLPPASQALCSPSASQVTCSPPVSQAEGFCARLGWCSKLLLQAFFIVSVHLCVSAQTDQNSTARNDHGGWVIAAYMGAAHTATSNLEVSQPTLGNKLVFGDVRFNSRSFEPPLYYGLRGGYFLDQLPFLGIEAEFIHLKVFSDPRQRVRVNGQRRGVDINSELPFGELVQQYSISHGVNLLLFNAAARHGLRDGRVILTGRAGIGPTLPHTESRIEGEAQEQYEIGSLAWQVAGGTEFKVWRGLYLFGEYKFTRTRQRGKVFSGESESLLRSHHGMFGLSYHF